MTETTTGTFGGRTAAEWKAEESRCYRTREESWERSDTDGFLSQWAMGQMATRYARLASLAENDGIAEMTAFVDIATGEVIKGQWRQTQYGHGWAPFAGGQWLFPSSAKSAATRDRNNAKKGFREVTVRVPMLLNHREMEAYPDRDAEWVVM